MFDKSTDLTHFHWFDPQDYRSTDGVEATLAIRTSEEGLSNRFVVHTRTRIWASYYDLKKQDELITMIRHQFGGSFHNDHAGTNRYINPDPDPRLPVGRGIYITYANIYDKLDAVRFAMPKPMVAPKGDPHDPFIQVMMRNDPSRVIYNGLVAFVVASLESFFGEIFKIMLKYDATSKERLKGQNKRVEMAELISVLVHETTLEELVANWYSFQNIDSINKAYSEWFGINVYKVLSGKRRVARRVKPLHQHYNDLIQRRHDFIHRFGFDDDLDFDHVQELLKLAKLVMVTFIEYLERDKGLLIHNADYGWWTDT